MKEYKPRKGAQGSRHAKQLAKQHRFKMSMYQYGVIKTYKDIQERAQAEAVTCIFCGQRVHPSNIKKHMMLYHRNQLIDKVGQSAIKIGGALLRQKTAKSSYALKVKPSATVRLIEVDGKAMIELSYTPMLPSPIITHK